MPHILVAGVSTRAAAHSAAVAGFEVTAIDAFGDLDQHDGVHVVSLADDFSPRDAARAARAIACDAVVYLANFENHPRAIAALADGRALWGNSADVVRRVRDPFALTEGLRRRGFAVPQVRRARDPASPPPAIASYDRPSTGDRAGDARETAWLMKPLASGGGQRIQRWEPTGSLPRSCYLQEFIEGQPGSVVFVAAGNRAIPLGVSRQLIGDPRFGATGYQYCGSILGVVDDPQFPNGERLADAAGALARAVTEEFRLVGLNGIDFIARDGVPWAVEVNPRWSASMELVERAHGISLLGLHAAACANGALPDLDILGSRRSAGATGKAIVFARQDVRMGDTTAWQISGDVGDIPHPGDRIRQGRPICTVFADGHDAAACHDALVQQAARLYAQLDAWYA